MSDHHEARMNGGQHAMAMFDALDDETLALFEPALESLTAIAERLDQAGLPKAHVLQTLNSLVISVVLPTDLDQQ